MPAYRYVKAPIVYINPDQASVAPRKRGWRRIIPSVLITFGSLLIANVAWPILSYQLFVAPDIKKISFVAPIDEQLLGSSSDLALQTKGAAVTSSVPQVLGADIDYTNPRNWFPAADFEMSGDAATYTIDIPVLDVYDAEVAIGGDNLDESLIHYPHTALPGELGSGVVFGHSVLRQFYNPSVDNERRYISIFSKIMTLGHGDRIYVTYDGIRYTYEVKEKVEVQPEDLFILEQRYNNRQLKLITCTPEGTYLRRGVVVAQLVDLADVQHDAFLSE